METAAPQKKAWERPENWVTWASFGLLGWIALKGLDYILPLLNRVLENLLYTCVLGGALAVVAWVVFSKDLHKIAGYGYKMLMRWLTELVITLDPIAIMKDHIEKLISYLEELKGAIESLRGQEQKLETMIRDGAAKQEHNMKLASAARKKGEDNVIYTRKANRAEKSAMTYQELLRKIRRHIALMLKIEKASKAMVEDIKDTVEEESQKRDMIYTSYKAMNAGKRILQQGSDREMYDMALEHVTNDYFQKLGEIEQFMADSKDFVMKMELEDSVVDEEAVAKLDAWEQRGQALLEGGSGKTKFRISSPDMSAELEGQAVHEAEEGGRKKQQSFADMFEKLD